MANHPNRGGISRNALELIATFSRHGIALDRDQQAAVATICRAALTVKRCAEAQCNGHPMASWRTVSSEEWTAWEDAEARREQRAEGRIAPAASRLPHVVAIRCGGDPRGATVKLVMDRAHQHMHDDWGREGVCVPGS